MVDLTHVVPAKFGQLFQEEKFDSLTTLFLYPKSQAKGAHLEDSVYFASVFRVMRGKWGAIEHFERSKGFGGPSGSLAMNTGDSAFEVDELPLCKDTVFVDVEFEKLKKLTLGFIQCNKGSHYSIGVMEFIKSFPKDLKGAPLEKAQQDFNAEFRKITADAMSVLKK